VENRSGSKRQSDCRIVCRYQSETSFGTREIDAVNGIQQKMWAEKDRNAAAAEGRRAMVPKRSVKTWNMAQI
jgi:hypothetical protein